MSRTVSQANHFSLGYFVTATENGPIQSVKNAASDGGEIVLVWEPIKSFVAVKNTPNSTAWSALTDKTILLIFSGKQQWGYGWGCAITYQGCCVPDAFLAVSHASEAWQAVTQGKDLPSNFGTISSWGWWSLTL
jgi:hypothetical protein